MNKKNKIWRRTAFAVLLLCSFAMILCGCGSSSKTTGMSQLTIGDVVDIPYDGVITAEQFAAFAGSNRCIKFKGSSSEIAYSWEFNGANIHNPVDMNLSVDFITNEDELSHIKEIAGNAPYAVGMKFNSEETVAAPILTIEMNEKWDADIAVFCFEQDGKAMKVSDAEITSEAGGSDGKTVLTVKVTDFKKTYYIVAGRSGKVLSEEESSNVSVSADNVDNEEAAGEDYKKTDGTDSDVKQETSVNSSNGKQEDNSTASSDSISANTSGNGSNNNQSSEKENKRTCTISINCSAILDNMESLKAGKEEFVPSSGWILAPVTVEFTEGESVFDVLKRVCRNNGIQMEHEYFPVYESTYIEGINQLYERDCGPVSGWKYSVNGWQPNYGCDKYKLSDGDKIEWTYTCSY